MKRIYKWTLGPNREQRIVIPRGSVILSIAMQGSLPQVWALCDPEEPNEPRTIALYGTGHDLPVYPGRYIATFQTDQGALVWHAFELPA